MWINERILFKIVFYDKFKLINSLKNNQKHLYIKLYKHEKTSFLWNIGEYINKFKNREEINEPYFIYKIDNILKSLEDKFILYFPKFKKSDLFFYLLMLQKMIIKEIKNIN